MSRQNNFLSVPLIILLLITGSITAATITLPATMEVSTGDFVTLKATTDGKIVKWVALDPGVSVFPADLLKDTQSTVVIVKNPGSYRVLAYTSDASGPSNPAIVTLVTKDAPVPVPPGPVPPGPGPAPDPTPPKADKIWIICVVDNDAPNKEVSKIIGDQAIWKKLQSQGNRYRIWPSSSRILDEKNMRRYLTDVGLPAMILMEPSGKVIKTVKIPTTQEAFENVIKGVLK